MRLLLLACCVGCAYGQFELSMLVTREHHSDAAPSYTDSRQERWLVSGDRLRREAGGVAIAGPARDSLESIQRVFADRTVALESVRPLPAISWNGQDAAGLECRLTADGARAELRIYSIEHAAAGLFPRFLPAPCAPSGRLPVRLVATAGNWAASTVSIYRVLSVKRAEISPSLLSTASGARKTFEETGWVVGRNAAIEMEDMEERLGAVAPAHRAMTLERIVRLAWESGDYVKAEKYAKDLAATPAAATYHLHNAHTVLGLLALSRNDVATALRHLKSSGAPEPVPVRIDLVERLLALGHLEAAADFYQAATTTENQELRRQYQGIAAALREKKIPDLGRHQPKLREMR